MIKKIKKIIKKIISDLVFLYRRFTCKLFGINCGGSGSGGGSGGNDGTVNNYNDIKLNRSSKDAIGLGYHRTGWPWVLSNLKVIHSKDGILFDDFFEQNFCYTDPPVIYKEPWVTIFHHPRNIPEFGNYRERLDVVFNKPEFKEASKNLKLAIALSDDLAEWLRLKLDCKVISLKHPIDDKISNEWSFEDWDKNKQLCQIGFYLRNTRLVEQIPDIYGVEFNRLWSDMNWLESYDYKVEQYWETKHYESLIFNNPNYFDTRYEYRDAMDHSISFVLPSRYDEILRTQVVIVEYFECSASNVILECISNNTPIIVNRIPATEQYLGPDYPLFFNHPEEIPDLIGKVKDANIYLKNMDKSDLEIGHFQKEILKEVNKIKK